MSMVPSRSGNPQQNGRHKGMHLTLKPATTKLAARNLLQQQAKFGDFIACITTSICLCDEGKRVC